MTCLFIVSLFYDASVVRRPNSASDPLLPAKAKRVQQAFFYTGDKRTDIGMSERQVQLNDNDIIPYNMM